VDKSIEKKINSSKALMETREIYDKETFIQLNSEINKEIMLLRKQKEDVLNKIKEVASEDNVYDIKEFIEEYKKMDIKDIDKLRKFFMRGLSSVVISGNDVTEIKLAPLY
jgi:site-specific DNA recombinase